MPFAKRRTLSTFRTLCTFRTLVTYVSISLVSITLLAWLVFRPSTSARAAAPAHAGQADAAIPVTATSVGTMTLPVYLTGVGSVTPLYDVTVRSQVDGQITRLHFKEGQQVREGDVLVEIDRQAFDADADQAASRLQQDQATLANARVDLGRQQRLAEANATSKQLVDAQQARFDELTAQVRGDQAALRRARVSVAYTTVRAPISGRVGFRLVDQGNLVKANDTALLSIVTTTPITVVYAQSQDALPAIHAALGRGAVEAVAMSTDGAAVLSHGRVSSIANRVDANSGAIRLKAEFDNADGALWPGQSVMIRTVVDRMRDAVTVPDDAIQTGPDGTFVYVIGSGDKVALQPVKVAHRVLGFAAVASGLRPGQRVVVQGQYRLQDGARVAATLQPPPTGDLTVDRTNDVPHDMDLRSGTATAAATPTAAGAH